MQDYIKSLQITIAPGGRHVEAVKMNESDGDYTTIRFSNVMTNAPLSKDLFELP
jgi:outer membrane lipoprotein-sorting protein